MGCSQAIQGMILPGTMHSGLVYLDPNWSYPIPFAPLKLNNGDKKVLEKKIPLFYIHDGLMRYHGSGQFTAQSDKDINYPYREELFRLHEEHRPKLEKHLYETGLTMKEYGGALSNTPFNLKTLKDYLFFTYSDFKLKLKLLLVLIYKKIFSVQHGKRLTMSYDYVLRALSQCRLKLVYGY